MATPSPPLSPDLTPLSAAFIRRAKLLGFTEPYIARLDNWNPDNAAHLKAFLLQNYHGTMGWMAQTAPRRQDPRNLWPNARSAIVLGMNYGPDYDPLDNLLYPEHGNISVYARGRDYHNVLKGRLKELAGLLARDLKSGPTKSDVKVFVDTAPLMEKPLAMQAGLGWQGKHTNLVSQTYGSWLFIGTILTSANIAPSRAEQDHCGSCRACLDICPTDAFPAPYQLDARRCISYLTIEHKGPVDEALRPALGNRIYGCDDCLAVCPWNKFAQKSQEIKLHARTDLSAPDLADLAGLSEKGFRVMFSGSPIKRIGWPRFLRNVLYAIGNSGAPKFKDAARAHLGSPEPAVKDAAIWALKRLEMR